MANAVAMAGICGAVVESSLVSGMNLSSSSSSRASVKPAMLAPRSQQQSEDNSSAVQGRRSMLSLLAASVAGAVLVKEASAATAIKVEGPPLPFGGLRTFRCTNFHLLVSAYPRLVFTFVSCLSLDRSSQRIGRDVHTERRAS